MATNKSRSRELEDDIGTDVSVTPITPNLIQETVENTTVRKRLVHTEAKLLVSLGYWVLPVKQLAKGYPEKQFNANSASNNPKKIDEWFHPMTSKYAGWNLAIACGFKEGSAVVVVDADRHGRADGVQEWRELIETHGEPEAHPWAKTPNDGEHHLFRWHPTFTKKSTKLSGDSALEVLGGKDGSFTSFALVYPSVVKDRSGDHKQYEWQVHPKDCRLPPTPDWLAASIGVTKQRPGSGGRGNENVADADLELIIPPDQIKRMLAVIDPDELSYSEWLTIGMAINSQHQDALHIWDQWSQQGSRDKSGECKSRWQGITTGSSRAKVTIGTLFHHARQHGWTPQKNDNFCDPVSLAVAELNQIYAHVVEGGHDRILRLRPDRDIGERHYDLIAPGSFSRMFPGQFIQHPNWEKARHLPKVWIESPYRRSYEFGLRLSPHEETPNGVFNTWNGFAFESVEGDCSLFLAHIRNVICCGDLDIYTWVKDWAADCVQDPGDLKGTAIVMRGREGTGKGTFANTLGRLFGAHYVHLIDANHLMGNFNAHLIDAIVVFADEITWGGNVKSQGKLKGLVSEQQLTGERKGIDAIQYRNFAHVIIASNSEWVVPAGGSSRRWLVLDIDDSRANDRSYFKAIHNELDRGGYEAFLYELQHREITKNLRWAPETEALADQRRLSAATRDKFFEFLDHKLSEGFWDATLVTHPDHGTCLSKIEVHRDYQQFTRDCGGVALSDVSFWKLWLKVFPYARGNQKEWPRTRVSEHITRVVVIRRRKEMCTDFLKHFGTASDEVRDATEDWFGAEPWI